MTPNQLVRVIARPINLNVSCELLPYSLQTTRSPPGPRLPKRIENKHLRNYYDLKGIVCRALVFAGFSGHGNSIHNIIALLKKENVQQTALFRI